MMIALNDASLANTAYRDWFEQADRHRAERVPGAKMYFSRIQLGHALEALNIAKEIRDSTTLRAAVAACDAATQRSFDRLTQFIDSPDYATLLRIRNNLAFHYDGRLAVRALRRIVGRDPSAVSSFTLGTEPILWHFPIADEIVDSMMVRDVLGIVANQPAQPATDTILERMWEMQVSFADFAGYFIRHYA